jgi:hypothetical protein
MRVQDIAKVFNLDADSLEKHLFLVKKRYEKLHGGYGSYLNETEVNAHIKETSKRAKDLSRSLSSLPVDLRDALNSICPDQKRANLLDNGDYADIDSSPEDFIEDTVHRLMSIQKAASTLKIVTFGEQSHKAASNPRIATLTLREPPGKQSRTHSQKKMFHKDRLVKDLRNCWRKLKGKKPSKSSGNNLFRDFMEQVCEYMEIDSKGLWRRHRDLP